MAKATYWQRGETLDFTNDAVGATKIDANTIVDLGGLVGVAGTDIAVGETGSLHVSGVYEMPKTSTNAITQGKKVYWDGSGITEASDNGGSPATPYTPAGYAALAAGATATKILVKLLG